MKHEIRIQDKKKYIVLVFFITKHKNMSSVSVLYKVHTVFIDRVGEVCCKVLYFSHCYLRVSQIMKEMLTKEIRFSFFLYKKSTGLGQQKGREKKFTNVPIPKNELKRIIRNCRISVLKLLLYVT